MKKSNFWIFIPLLIVGFIGLALVSSFCITDNFCLENQALGIIFMIVGFGGFLGSLFYINNSSNR